LNMPQEKHRSGRRPLRLLNHWLRGLRQRGHERFVRWALRVPTPEPVPITLVQRRVYVLPTRVGLAFGLALVSIFLGAVNYNLSLGHALVFWLAGLGLVSILHTFRNLVQLTINPGRCAPVFAGETACFDLLLTNTRRDARTHLLLSANDLPPIDMDIPPHSTSTARIALPTNQRGWMKLPRITIETTWPLGLVRAWSYVAPAMQCLVYPAPAKTAPPLPFSGATAQGARHTGQGADDFAGLRGHQRSDPPRHVAWKAAARQDNGKLQTKLFSGESAQELWLDWEAAPANLTTEQRIACMTRWLLDADAAGMRWGLRLPTLRLAPAQGAAHRATGLQALALYALPGVVPSKTTPGPPKKSHGAT
jgi:uncharacterized protein (DUF58 family)